MVLYRDPVTGRLMSVDSFVYGMGSVLDIGASSMPTVVVRPRRRSSDDMASLRADAARAMGDLARAIDRERPGSR